MMRFLVGVLAAILWTGTLIGLFIIFRSSPQHPFRSIKEFRLARHRLSRPSGPLVEVVNEADLVEAPVFVQRRTPSPPEPELPLEEFEPAFQDDLEPEEPIDTAGLWDEDEGAEIEAEDDEDEDEEWEDGDDEEEYEEAEDEVLAAQQEEDEEGSSSLDIILVDDFGKPAR